MATMLHITLEPGAEATLTASGIFAHNGSVSTEAHGDMAQLVVRTGAGEGYNERIQSMPITALTVGEGATLFLSVANPPRFSARLNITCAGRVITLDVRPHRTISILGILSVVLRGNGTVFCDDTSDVCADAYVFAERLDFFAETSARGALCRVNARAGKAYFAPGARALLALHTTDGNTDAAFTISHAPAHGIHVHGLQLATHVNGRSVTIHDVHEMTENIGRETCAKIVHVESLGRHSAPLRCNECRIAGLAACALQHNLVHQVERAASDAPAVAPAQQQHGSLEEFLAHDLFAAASSAAAAVPQRAPAPPRRGQVLVQRYLNRTNGAASRSTLDSGGAGAGGGGGAILVTQELPGGPTRPHVRRALDGSALPSAPVQSGSYYISPRFADAVDGLGGALSNVQRATRDVGNPMAQIMGFRVDEYGNRIDGGRGGDPDGPQSQWPSWFGRGAAPRRPPPPVSVPAVDRAGPYPVTEVNADGVRGSQCRICLKKHVVNTNVQPCGHAALCRPCALAGRASGVQKCPMCNAKIESITAFILSTADDDDSDDSDSDDAKPAPKRARSTSPVVQGAAASTERVAQPRRDIVAAAAVARQLAAAQQDAAVQSAAQAETAATTTTAAAAPTQAVTQGQRTWQELDMADDEALARRLQVEYDGEAAAAAAAWD